MKKELLNRKETTFDDSENFEPIQMVKDAKIKRLIARIVCSGHKAKGGQPLASAGEIRH